jgi:hypothetical protein
MQRNQNNNKPTAQAMSQTTVVNNQQSNVLLSYFSMFCMPCFVGNKSSVIDLQRIDYKYPHNKVRY